MVQFDKVGQFVDHHVVYYRGRGLDQAPVEADATAAGAASPAGAGAAKSESRHAYVKLAGIKYDPLLEKCHGLATVPLHDSVFERSGIGWVGQRYA